MFKRTIIFVALTISGLAYADGNSITCSDSEVQSYMDNYKKGFEKEGFFSTPKFTEWKNARMAAAMYGGGDQEANLCDILMDSSFDPSQLMPDWSNIQKAYDAMKAFMSADSGGIDAATIVGAAVKAGLEHAKQYMKEGVGKAGKAAARNLNDHMNDLYNTAKDKGQSVILSDSSVQKLGVTDFERPIWQQMAGKKLDETLDDYSDYSKWYEDVRGGKKEVDPNSTSLIDILSDSTFGNPK